MIKHEVRVGTKYKTIAKKVRLVASLLPFDGKGKNERAFMQPNFRDLKKVEHKFKDISILDGLKVWSDDLLMDIERKYFEKMLSYHGEAFAVVSHKFENLRI